MQDTVVVAVRDAPRELVEEGLEHGQLKATLDLVQVLLQVVVEELEDKRELSLRVHDVI